MPTRLDLPHAFFLIFLIQILATAMMTGIIWFVQIVHYPLFVKIPGEGFTAYERSHTVRTGWVVAPLMLVELGSAVTLLLFPRLIGCSGMLLTGDPLYLAALGCLILIWASTFLLQVPLHGILEQKPDTRSMDRLVTTNWIRTILWTLRLGLLGILAARLTLP
ncbi:MAG: hypothetical protein ACOYOI_10195 [Chthoniobacterales bacterium]